MNPVSQGGTNDLLNLITSCVDCNLGKSDRTLADTTIIDRQRTQMEELQERREQIEMMMDWQRGLLELDHYLIEQVAEFWAELVEPYKLSEQGLKSLKKLLRQHNADEIMEAMRIATTQYLEYDNGQVTQKSISYAWSKIGGICKTKKLEKTKPYIQKLFYIRGILRKRLNYLNEWLCLKLLEEAYQCGANLDQLQDHACKVRTWTKWRQEIEYFIQCSRDTQSDCFIEINEDELYDSKQHNQESEEEENREEMNQLIQICNSYAQTQDYKKIAEMCNNYLDVSVPEIQEYLLQNFEDWFVTTQGNRFIVDLVRLQTMFNDQYIHWSIDYTTRCIYTLDSGDEYYIDFETLSSDERKLLWIQQLSSKTWSTPEMIAELSEILQDSPYISLDS
ncbi:MAG: HNH endonuclease [Roseofilum sp. Guam]|nr:HNH endonuclease [Roseofilum sp. Guam]